MNQPFTLFFLFLLVSGLLAQLWLARRHVRHVAAHRERVPDAFAERVALAAHQKAADYTIAKSRFGMLGLVLDALILLAFTLGGGLQAIHDFWASRLDGLWQGLALIFSVMAVSSLLGLPLALYRQFVIEARFGFNRMTLGLFFADLFKQTLLGLALGGPVILAVLWLMGAMGEYWWFYVWLFWSGFNLLILFIYPTWIAPLFNKFSPLEDEHLKARIESLLARCGFRSQGLFVMDGSKRSSHGNAYFTGFGQARRIVFFDTLLSRLKPEEIEAVLAHELGHFKKKHIVQRIAMMFALSLVFLWVLGKLMDASWFYQGLGVQSQTTALALVLFFFVLPLVTFPAIPLGSLLSRHHEFEADAYAVSQTNAEDLAHALVKLYEDNAATLTPDPWHSLFYDSHPPAAIRLAHLQTLGAIRP